MTPVGRAHSQNAAVRQPLRRTADPAMSNGIALPPDVNPQIPSPARIYDYYLGGCFP